MCIRDSGKGGNIIALAQELYSSDHVPYLLQRIGELAPGLSLIHIFSSMCRTADTTFSFPKVFCSQPQESLHHASNCPACRIDVYKRQTHSSGDGYSK